MPERMSNTSLAVGRRRTWCRSWSNRPIAANAPRISTRWRNRTIFLGTPIDDTVANLVVGQLLFLAQDDAGATSSCTSTVRAGPIDAGLAIYDTMHLIQPQVATTVAGVAASTAAWLLAGGATGKRSALPNSRILIHQASSGFQGTAADIDIQARELLRLETRMQELLADTGQPVERIVREINRDFWMTAQDALAYGIIDTAIGQTEKVPAADRAEPGATDGHVPTSRAN
jgi:ATP-dependent Clp protease, protease subunit